jgi:flagellar protein FlaF
MYQQAAQAYRQANKTVANPRDLESGLLLRAAARLQAISDDWTRQDKELDQALTFNRKLWTILVSFATGETSELPHDLQENIANLATFIFKRTMDTMIEPTPEKLTDRKSTRLNSSHNSESRMPSSA